MSEKTRKMILIKDGIDLDIFDDKNMSDRVLMLDYPEGTVMEQLHKFYKLIGKECENVEIVHPKRLYTLTEEQYPVMMLVDEEYLYHKTAQINPIASYLYETDVHGHPINGNVLISCLIVIRRSCSSLACSAFIPQNSIPSNPFFIPNLE